MPSLFTSKSNSHRIRSVVAASTAWKRERFPDMASNRPLCVQQARRQTWHDPRTKERRMATFSRTTTALYSPQISMVQQQWFGTSTATTTPREKDTAETWFGDLPPAYRPSRYQPRDSSSSSSSFRRGGSGGGSGSGGGGRFHNSGGGRSSLWRKQKQKGAFNYPTAASKAQKKKEASERAVLAQVQPDLDHLKDLSNELQRLMVQYKTLLVSGRSSNSNSDDNNATTQPSSRQKNNNNNVALGLLLHSDAAKLRNQQIDDFVRTLRQDLQALENEFSMTYEDEDDDEYDHDDDHDEDDHDDHDHDEDDHDGDSSSHSIHFAPLKESENVFRELCEVLRDVVTACCTCYKHETARPVTALIAYAEFSFEALAILREQRSELYDLELLEEARRLQARAEEEQKSFFAPFSAVVDFLAKNITKLTDLDSFASTNERIWAHEDLELAPSQLLLRQIVEAMALSATSGEAVELDNLETRAVELLDTLDTSTPELLTILSILEVLCHAGTLEAAEECSRLFGEYSDQLPHLPFSLVLRAYLEASRKETIHERKRKIAQQLLDLVHERWRKNFPRHQEERIAQGASVLHCIALSGMSKDPDIKTAVDVLVKRVTGNVAYRQFAKASTSIGGQVEAPFVPIVNYRARVYATSGDPKNIRLAKVMVTNILPQETKGKNNQQYIKYPNVKTINTVLEGIVRLHQERRKGLDEGADLVFCESILDFCMSRRELGVWANTETFELIMNLYTALKPPNIGQRMEELISSYETRVYMSKTPAMNIPLATYNRVIWAIWEEAKSPQPRRASQRALALLDKLEMLSTPLLLTRKQVLTIRDFDLYLFDLKPTSKTYEMVLNVCADTVAESEYEMAAKVALAVGNRLLNQPNVFKENAIDKIQTCLDRLEPDSNIVEPMKFLVAQLREKTEERSQPLSESLNAECVTSS